MVQGELTHQDSMGTKETITRGAIQFMTAGRGVTHSEHNLNKEKDLRFIQIWIQPTQRGLNSNYGSYQGNEVERRNTWAHLVSNVKDSKSTPIKINQDANIFVAEVDGENSVEFPLREGRQGYLLCVEGQAKVTGSHGEETLDQHDAAEVYGENRFQVRPNVRGGKTHVLFIEMAFTGQGRTDL